MGRDALRLRGIETGQGSERGRHSGLVPQWPGEIQGAKIRGVHRIAEDQYGEDSEVQTAGKGEGRLRWLDMERLRILSRILPRSKRMTAEAIRTPMNDFHSARHFPNILISCGLASTMSACRPAAGFPGPTQRPMKKSSFMLLRGTLMFGLMDISGA